MHETKQLDLKRSGQGHRRRNDAGETSVLPWLRQHQNRNMPAGESLKPAAFPALIHGDITTHPQERGLQ